MKDIINNKLEYTQKSTLVKEEEIFTSLSTAALLAKGAVPHSHRRAADNYVIIKRIYKFQAVQARISIAELDLLKKYDLQPLECTTIKQITEELSFLKKWSVSSNETLSEDADNIIQIRTKELKNIASNNYALVTNEIYNGYMGLERYFNEITKY